MVRRRNYECLTGNLPHPLARRGGVHYVSWRQGTLHGTEFDPELKRRVRCLIAEPRDLPEDRIYSKERRLRNTVKLLDQIPLDLNLLHFLCLRSPIA